MMDDQISLYFSSEFQNYCKYPHFEVMIKGQNIKQEINFFSFIIITKSSMLEQTDFMKKWWTQYSQNTKIISIPLQFSFLPVDIISKEFTKFNNPYEHRIYYLGPRFSNTQTLHKKYAYSQTSPMCGGAPHRKINKYHFDAKRIAHPYGIQIIEQQHSTKAKKHYLYKFGVYYRAFEGPNPTLNFSQQFIFHANFQSANLDSVVQFKPLQFDLFLRVDSNSRGHLNWFYFSIENSGKLTKIRLNICNMLKGGTLYQQQMQPYIFSRKAFETRQQSWMQGYGVSNLSFSQKPYNYDILEGMSTINPYCLSFDYQFQFEFDQVFFAYCIPYTYSQLLYDTSMLPHQFSRLHSLGYTLSGLQIPLLHITQHSTYNSSKRNILITGRVHPGQSNGSLVLKGFIEFLCSNNVQAAQIRKVCNFYIIPMINPDGVILGNSRCSASGRDLNRVFPFINKQLFPEIQLLKSFTTKFLEHNQILIYFDFHGHSKKKNTFFYGPSFSISSPNYLKCRILPRIIENLNSCFRFYSCNFTISESKKSTARATMFETFKIPFTYTVETSIGLYYDNQQFKTFSFNKEKYLQIGGSICEGTSTFVIALNQYQNFLKLRKTHRQRKRNLRSSQIRRNYIDNHNHNYYSQSQSLLELEMSNIFVMNNKKENEQQCLFIKLLQQVKKLSLNQKTQKQSNFDNDISSDDHDTNQNLQQAKFHEFYQLVTGGTKKNRLLFQTNSDTKNQTNKLKKTNKRQSENQQKFIKQTEINLQQEQLSLFEEIDINTKQKLRTPQRTPQYIRNRTQFKSPKQVKINVAKRYNSNSQSNQFFKGLFGSSQLKLQIDNSKMKQKTLFRNNLFETLMQQSHKPPKIKNDIKIIRNTIKMKNKSGKMKVERSAHYSEIQFPKSENEKKNNKNQLMEQNKTDLFRRTFTKKKGQASNHMQNLYCQIKIIKHAKKQFLEQQNVKNRKMMVLYRIDDLMSNLQMRAKQMRDSLRHRDEKKLKARRNTGVPSSIYEIKQKITSKRKRSFSSDKKTIQQTEQLTVKQFNNN